MMRWIYKTVHFALKKEGLLGAGFLDEHEIEEQLNEYGRSGWELISAIEVHDGVITFFKQPIGAGLPATRPTEAEDEGGGWEDAADEYPEEETVEEYAEEELEDGYLEMDDDDDRELAALEGDLERGDRPGEPAEESGDDREDEEIRGIGAIRIE